MTVGLDVVHGLAGPGPVGGRHAGRGLFGEPRPPAGILTAGCIHGAGEHRAVPADPDDDDHRRPAAAAARVPGGCGPTCCCPASQSRVLSWMLSGAVPPRRAGTRPGRCMRGSPVPRRDEVRAGMTLFPFPGAGWTGGAGALAGVKSAPAATAS
jgi:hypothetical protein